MVAIHQSPILPSGLGQYLSCDSNAFAGWIFFQAPRQARPPWLENVAQGIGREATAAALGTKNLVSLALAATADTDREGTTLDSGYPRPLNDRLSQFSGKQRGVHVLTGTLEEPTLERVVDGQRFHVVKNLCWGGLHIR